MDLSFKNQFQADDFTPAKPGQVAISNLLGLFSSLSTLGGLFPPKMIGSYNVDKEAALNQQREQQQAELSFKLAEQSLRMMANALEQQPTDQPNLTETNPY